MTRSANVDGPGATGFTRPLLLTPGQNLAGWLAGHLGRALLWTITASSMLAVILIFLFIVREAALFVADHGLGEALGSKYWYPRETPPVFGMLSMVYGSLIVTLGALLLAVPVGILTAVFLSDMVPFGVRQAVKPVIELLAAIPSVAFGFFAALVLAPWMQDQLHLTTGTNALNGAIILGVMAIPTIVSVAEDSLSSVGRELREASYALGATRAETLVKVVIPAAHSGIIAAVILGMMRSLGETMAVWMASGNAAQIPTPWWDLTSSIRTLTATIAAEMGETAQGSDHYRALFVIGLLLLTFSFGMNLVTEHLLHRMRRTPGLKTTRGILARWRGALAARRRGARPAEKGEPAP